MQKQKLRGLRTEDLKSLREYQLLLTLVIREWLRGMEAQLSKQLYKIELWVLKFIPYVLAVLQFIDTILISFGIIVPFLSYMACVSPIVLLFLYISSYAFKFCEYHRIPLHYMVFNKIIITMDYWIQFPITDYHWALLQSLLFGLFALMCGILKLFKKI